jgi:hypothetical protein
MASLRNLALPASISALPPNIWARKMIALLAKWLSCRQILEMSKLPAQIFGTLFLRRWTPNPASN